jgi:transglutaminase-like putative cysteine protease
VFEGTHTTTYRYSQPVFLEPYLLRLRPCYESAQRLRHFALHLEPQPAGLSESRDVEGNDVTLAAGRTPQLAAPITGSFRGTGVSTNMQADIRLRVSSLE